MPDGQAGACTSSYADAVMGEPRLDEDIVGLRRVAWLVELGMIAGTSASPGSTASRFGPSKVLAGEHPIQRARELFASSHQSDRPR